MSIGEQLRLGDRQAVRIAAVVISVSYNRKGFLFVKLIIEVIEEMDRKAGIC